MKFDMISRSIGILLMAMTTLMVVISRPVCAEESVLWWMFDETTDIFEVNGTGSCKINELVGRGDAEGKTVNGIRIGAYSGDELLGYLLIGEEQLDTMKMPDKFTYEGQQYDIWSAGPEYAKIGYFSGDPTISFAIELGNLNDENIWSILASSDKAFYNDLTKYISSTFDMHTETSWTGGSYSVPEPNSGILLLIGTGLLLLKRKTNRQHEQT